jgi:hypothetical protein
MKANTTITILEAVTNVNSISKKSRIENTSLFIGNEVYKREDGIFFENVNIDGKEFRPFYEFKNNQITLDCISSSRVKSITIKKFN